MITKTKKEGARARKGRRGREKGREKVQTVCDAFA